MCRTNKLVAQLVSSTEDERKEKLLLEQQRHFDVSYDSRNHINNVHKAEDLRTECHLAPIRPFLPPPSMPVTVIPIVTTNPTGSPTLPVPMLSPTAAPPLASARSDPHSLQEECAAALPRSPQPKPDPQTAVVTANHKQAVQNHDHHLQLSPQTSNNNLQQQTHHQLLQRYPGPIVSPPQQHALLPQSLQQTPTQNDHSSRGSPSDDGRLLDLKKRPGG